MSTRKILLGGLSLSVFVTLSSCKSGQRVEQQTTAPTNWSGQMQNLAEDVKRLLPYLYNREAYRDPMNRAKIAASLKEFAATAEHVKPEMGQKILGDDLLVQSALSSLSEDLNRAVRSFNSGQFEYSRSVAKASLSYCFQCHSVTHPSTTARWDLDQLQTIKLPPVERADLLVAIRKYDKALEFMEEQLQSKDIFKTHAFDYESLLRRYLALVIRVENNPKRARLQLEKILKNGEVPHYIVEQVEGWMKSIDSWGAEPVVVIKSPKQLFELVDRRFKKASGIQHFEKDHAGDVEYLRITEDLHQGLKVLKTADDQARALFLLGRAYEVLDDLGAWNLHESYYEACIQKVPQAPLAKSCYNRLEASLYLGYSGSSGTHLPFEERERLKRLRNKVQGP